MLTFMLVVAVFVYQNWMGAGDAVRWGFEKAFDFKLDRKQEKIDRRIDRLPATPAAPSPTRVQRNATPGR